MAERRPPQGRAGRTRLRPPRAAVRHRRQPSRPARRAGEGDTPARRAQAERLAALVTGLRENGDLTVVCGDLNLLPGSETFEILAGLGLVDLVRDADTRTSRYLKPVRHASYLLVSDPGAVKQFEIMAAPEVSDHRALLLDLLD
ncbi:endonuclease/exonuclease/phosphatase family protein [Nonomuraea antimicrobica]